VHDRLFASQPKLEDADLEKVATDAGLNLEKVRDAMKNHKYKAQIDGDADLGDDVQASGTPHFFVNGRRVVGAQPFEHFKAIIDEEIARASAVVAKGVPASGVYDAIMKTATVPPFGDERHVTARASAPAKGAASASVVIEEFSDFQCPFCARAQATLHEAEKAYPGKVKVIWRNLPLPFHQNARLAAEAAAEAQRQKGDTAFWAMHDKLFANQSGAGLERPALERYAAELGLDMDAFKQALDEHSHAAELDADGEAADMAHITGTPAFIVDGYLLSGAQPLPKFRRLIDHALASPHRRRPE